MQASRSTLQGRMLPHVWFWFGFLNRFGLLVFLPSVVDEEDT